MPMARTAHVSTSGVNLHRFIWSCTRIMAETLSLNNVRSGYVAFKQLKQLKQLQQHATACCMSELCTGLLVSSPACLEGCLMF